MAKIPTPRKPPKAKACEKKSGCLRAPGHPGRCGALTKAERSASTTPTATTTKASRTPKSASAPTAGEVAIPKKRPIAEALKEVKSDPLTREIAQAIPKTQKKKCPACGRPFVARPSGLLPPHKDAGEPCPGEKKKATKKASAKTKGKKYLCAVSEKDGCGRMIGVMTTGMLSKHIRKDGTPCPGGDLLPGSPLPKVKKVHPVNPKSKPKSRPIHDRNERSEYFKAPGLSKSQLKAEALADVCAQYGWDPTYREHDETIELTMTRGSETIYIYWVAGVCAGEHITYTREDYTTKLRNASAVKMRAAVEPKVSMAEVKKKVEHRVVSSKRMQELNKEKVQARAIKKNPNVTLGQKIAKETDDKIVAMIAGKWIGWRNRISGNEEIAEVGRDPRQIIIKMSTLDDDRIISILDPLTGYRAFRLSALLRVQTNPMRRRTSVGGDDEDESRAKPRKKAVRKTKA